MGNNACLSILTQDLSNKGNSHQTKFLPFLKQEAIVLRLYNITRMKIRTNLTAFLSILGIFCFSFAFGQDDRLPDLDYGAGNNRENRVEPSPDGLNDVEVKNVRNTPAQSNTLGTTSPAVVRDTPDEAKPTAKKAESKPKTDQDESVLNFNFLYYLIERFKLSDIVD